MNYKIAKEFRWEMCHRLPFHEGLCRNLHGHSYKLKLGLEGQLNEQSMVMDYYQIEKIVKPVLNKLDHSCLCNENDTELINFLKNNDFKFLAVPFHSTAENIASFILNEIKDEFQKHPNLFRLYVRVEETSDVHAEVYCDINL